MRHVTLMVLAILCVVGCSNRAAPRTVLRVADWSVAGEDAKFDALIQNFLRKFERDHPGVRLQREGVPGEYKQKMLLNFVAGTMPDVMTVDASSAAVFVDNGCLRDLTPFLTHDPTIKLSSYYRNVLSIGQRGNRIYMIPGDFTPMAVYFNRDLFDRAHVPYPDSTWNFAKFREVARRLTIPGKQYGFAFSNWMPGWVMWLWNNGGDTLSPDGKRAEGFLDSPQNVATLRFLRDLILVDKSAPSQSQMESQGVDLFASGQAAMTVSGHWSLVGYKEPPKDAQGRPEINWRHLGVVAMPHNTPRSHTVMYEAGYGISVDSKHPELAWQFIRMWTGRRFQSKYNQSGIAVSARRDVSRERALEQSIDAEFEKLIPEARPPYGSRVQGYEYVETKGQDALSSILNNGVPVATALHDAAVAIDKEFAKE